MKSLFLKIFLGSFLVAGWDTVFADVTFQDHPSLLPIGSTITLADSYNIKPGHICGDISRFSTDMPMKGTVCLDGAEKKYDRALPAGMELRLEDIDYKRYLWGVWVGLKNGNKFGRSGFRPYEHSQEEYGRRRATRFAMSTPRGHRVYIIIEVRVPESIKDRDSIYDLIGQVDSQFTINHIHHFVGAVKIASPQIIE
jgi:hypothetical protein